MVHWNRCTVSFVLSPLLHFKNAHWRRTKKCPQKYISNPLHQTKERSGGTFYFLFPADRHLHRHHKKVKYTDIHTPSHKKKYTELMALKKKRTMPNTFLNNALYKKLLARRLTERNGYEHCWSKIFYIKIAPHRPPPQIQLFWLD